ncbi:MAG: nuclear transport factor 2 family protein [Acidobacteriia bacterium]|nr:nuclear transport factor 2 family protein [Terriglobia bacterium]
MTKIFTLFLMLFTAVSFTSGGQESALKTAAPAAGPQGAKNADLEKELWGADQQWLCSAGATPYHKDYKECIEFRSHYWTDQFFEISNKGQVTVKAGMIAAQSAAHPAPGIGPHPDDFHLMAVYGNVAFATDHTDLKSMGPDGKVVDTNCRVLRIFVKENGKWRPAGGALVPIVQ